MASSTFAALHSIQSQSTGSGHSSPSHVALSGSQGQARFKSIKFNSINANIVQANEACNGFLYIIDNVLLLPEDTSYIVQTSQSPTVSSTMSSLLGGHNSILFDFLQTLLSPAANSSASYFNLSTNSFITIISSLTLAIAFLLILALILIIRKSRQNKLRNNHQQLESGLTSSSSANSTGSTSTTKSL